jgi:hypothetical protein
LGNLAAFGLLVYRDLKIGAANRLTGEDCALQDDANYQSQGGGVDSYEIRDAFGQAEHVATRSIVDPDRTLKRRSSCTAM